MDGDRELVERLQAGDHEAFERLYRRHKDRLYRHALVQTGGRSGVAEEVVQDVFLSLYEGRMSPQHNVAGYLLVTTRNRALNACSRREDRDGELDEEAVAALVAPSVERPDAVAGRREEARRLARALLELRPEEREVVLLRAFEELPWREVAALTGAPLPTASSRYRAALNRLKEVLQPSGTRSLSHA
jgi:RNA polymerase sigma-70 factor, ECF subfamily